HPAWAARDVMELVAHCRILEGPPGDTPFDNLLDGLDEPAKPPVPAPERRPQPVKPAFDRPENGGELYRWATALKLFPTLVALGKKRGYPNRVVEWDIDQVHTAYEILAKQAANGEGRRP